MNVVSAVIIGGLLLLLSASVIALVKQRSSILQIAAKMEELTKEDTQEYLMLFSTSGELKDLMAAINRLLEKHYNDRTAHQKTKRQMEQVLTNISHDIKTPLTVISGYVEVLQEQICRDDVSEEIAETVEKLSLKTAAAVRLVTQFFNMAKIESGDMVSECRPVELCACCREIILEYYDILEKKNARVQIEIPEKPLYVQGDMQALERILKNLLDNAVRYGMEGKYIGFRLQEKAGEYTIEVEDHGKGILPKQQQMIFHRDYSLDKKAGGSGLGLAIAQKLAQSMRGFLSVSSIPWEKTVFTLHLKK